MKSIMTEEQKKQKKAQDKEVRDSHIFNEKLQNSELFNDEQYVFENMNRINIGLKGFPKEYLGKTLMMTEYFKRKRSVNNYKYIKPELLNNKIFLSVAIKENPDLYLIMNEKFKKDFVNGLVGFGKEYLKYLSKEDFESYMQLPIKNFRDYRTSYNIIKWMRLPIYILSQLNIIPKITYYKYFKFGK